MRCQEGWRHDAIAVEENNIAAGARRNRAIADFGEAKAPILLPDVRDLDTDLGLPRADEVAGGRTRSIVGDYDLEVLGGLPAERAQARAERIGPVVGRDDDRDVSHGAASQAMPSD